jgi:hypothetical protein
MIDAIEKLIELSKVRSDPSFWDANIIEAHALCRHELDHKHFWSYLSNPEEYDPMLVDSMKTLGDRINEMDVDELAKPVIMPLPDYMEEIIHQNGNHISIEYKNRKHKLALLEEHDEKAES